MTSAVSARNIANYASDWSLLSYAAETGLRPLEAGLVREFFPSPPARVLDLGCGAGRTTIGLSDLGYDVLGIDLSSALLQVARRRFPSIAFAEMDATRLELADGTFDAAIFSYNGIDCIYPAAARRRCLAETWRVLRPGGVFILSSHNFVGATFSGGYFYPRGYWNAIRFLARQVTNPLAWRWYLRYDDPGGTQYLYSAPPGRTVSDSRAAGFSVVAVRGSAGARELGRARMREQHVHFVLSKPL
ncbi:MAG: class I SAM-dependent methyltransferase [Vicinamibacterales bacterium]